jgi:hypothetical protein
VYIPPSETKPVPESARSKSPAIVIASLGLALSNGLNLKWLLFGSLDGGRFRFASSSAKQDGQMDAWSVNLKNA